MKKEIRYYCKQGDPTCVYPKCTCNTVEPDEKKSKGQTLHIASVDSQRELLPKPIEAFDKAQELSKGDFIDWWLAQKV